MTGTVINTLAIVAGSLLGSFVLRGVPEGIKVTVIKGIGLSVALIGLSMGLGGKEPLVLIGSLALGGVAGEGLRLDDRLNALGERLQARWGGVGGQFAQGFVTASLVYCVGAMAVMGALQDGLSGDYSILLAKSMLDGITAVFFSAAMGVGVAFSAIPVFLYQGGIALLAGWVKGALSEPVVREMTAVGGLLILGIGLNLLEAARVKVANLLPAILVAAAWMRLKG